MRRATIRVAAIAALALCAGTLQAGPLRPRQPAPPVYGIALAPGDRVGTIDALDLHGKPASIDFAAAKLTLVNFWATWCQPCRVEMPALEKIRARRQKKGLNVVGVVVQDAATAAEIRQAADEAKVAYTVVQGGVTVERAWGGINLLPTTFLVDPKGTILRKYVGTTPEQVRALGRDVDDYLAGRPLGKPYVPPPVPDPAAVGGSGR